MELQFPRHGGRRPGAGRKPGRNPRVRDRSRPQLASRFPCHVTLRLHRGAPSLRSRRLVRDLQQSFALGCDRGEFRVIHYSLLRDHVHLIVEARDRHALGRGMKSVTARLRRSAERVFGWRGALLGDRYHLRILRTPHEVRHAVAYVLLNARRHRTGRRVSWTVDPASSGRWFDGWRRVLAPETHAGPRAVAPPRTWLLRAGWRRWGRVDPAEVPGLA